MIKIFLLLVLTRLIRIVSSQTECKCTPTSSCWPSTTEWTSFNESLSGALIQGVPPGSVCYPDQPNYNESLCSVALEQWTNSTWHASDPVSIDYTYWTNNSCNPIFQNGTDINGNPNAGKEGCIYGNFPVFVVNATQVEHVSLALKWAAQKNIRVVIKNTGHSFLGKSTGYGSLSIWTHNLRGVEYIDSFKPTSCSMNNMFQAVRVGAGETGIDVLNQVAEHGVVVVTGGNTDVGLAGWMPGGGHGYLSSTYGMGADNLLEAAIVTPDGEVLIANPCQNEDLFYATRGGGGGTFGVIMSAVVRAYPSPQTTGHDFNLTLLDPSKETEFWNMIGYIHAELPRLNAAGMAGYYFIYGPPVVPIYVFSWTMYIYDKPNGTVEALMEPIMARLNNQSSIFSYGQQVSWYANFIDAYGLRKPEAVGTPAATMGSRLLSTESLSDAGRVAEVLSGIGCSAEVSYPVIFSGSITASNQVPSYYPEMISMTPVWRNTTLHLVLIGVWDETLNQSSVNEIFHDMTWNKTQSLRDLSPNTGAYMNECDYFEPDWQTSLYGPNYPRLYEIKQKYDPEGLFWCERCVGSEEWVQMDDQSLCRPFGY